MWSVFQGKQVPYIGICKAYSRENKEGYRSSGRCRSVGGG